jgi:hypothetical protein
MHTYLRPRVAFFELLFASSSFIYDKRLSEVVISALRHGKDGRTKQLAAAM